MDRCASCDRELASTWKFCIYCGQPIGTDTGNHSNQDSEELHHSPIGSAPRKRSVAFWVGMGIGVIGLGFIIFAAIQLYGVSG